MVCPKCEEGTIVKVKLKKNGKVAYLCDFCERMWFEGEDIDKDAGHTLGSHQNGEREYTIGELEEKDQNHKPVRFVSPK